MKANTIQEYFGTLQQSVLTGWRKHLKASKHNVHVILDDFYDDMLDAVDALIEGYQAHNEKVEDYKNVLDNTKQWEPQEYLEELYSFTKDNRKIVGDSTELQSLVDDVLNVINEALYKIKDLTKDPNENQNEFLSLKDFINESLNN